MPSPNAIRSLALLACLAPLGPAGAETMALIVDSKGAVTPAAMPFSEAESGARFDLAPDAELIVIHYASCVESHFRGGAVSIGPEGVSGDGDTIAETRIECPRKVAFAQTADASASVILRGDEEIVAINARPVFVLLGGGGDAVEVAENGRTLARLDAKGGLARWPEDMAPLEAGVAYEIVLPSEDGARRAAPATVRSGAGLTVVQP